MQLRRPVHPAVDEVVVVEAELAGLEREPEALLARPDGSLGLHPLGDVHPDPVQHDRPIAVVRRAPTAVHPVDRPVGVAEAELDDVVGPVRDGVLDGVRQGGLVLREDELAEGLLTPAEGPDRDAEQRLQLRAPGHDVRREVARPPAHPPATHRERERALRLAEELLCPPAGVDVGRGAVPARLAGRPGSSSGPHGSGASARRRRPSGSGARAHRVGPSGRPPPRRRPWSRPGRRDGRAAPIARPPSDAAAGRTVVVDPAVVGPDRAVLRRDPDQMRNGIGQVAEAAARVVASRALGPGPAGVGAGRQASSFSFMHVNVWPIILLAVPSISRAPSGRKRYPRSSTSAFQSIRVPPASPSLRSIEAVASTALPGAWPWALITRPLRRLLLGHLHVHDEAGADEADADLRRRLEVGGVDDLDLSRRPARTGRPGSGR